MITLAIFTFSGCKSIPIDTFPPAAASGVPTLIIKGCESVSKGLTGCWVKEESFIEQTVSVYLPTHDRVLGGELTISLHDSEKTFGVKKNQNWVKIPLSTLFQHSDWQKDDRGVALMTATLRYMNAEDIETIWKAFGYLHLIVEPKNFVGGAVDSGFMFFKDDFECQVAYSTAGRSGLQCD